MSTTFTTRHYVALANVVKPLYLETLSIEERARTPKDKTRAWARSNAIADVISKLADTFEADNPIFERGLFVKAATFGS